MKQTAQGLAALGRGPDTELVHMTPGEVKSLQQLAMANGGSLTINPETGLPEAGFLSSMLPMLIGAGITAATGGAAAPWMVGLGVGGAQALRTGSLKDGIMAGFGAYGGAGLGAGLAEAGAQSAANTQIAGDAAYKAAQENALTQAEALGKNALPYTPEGFAAQARDITAPLNTMRDTALTGQQAAFTTGGFGQNLQTMGQGISSLGSEAGRGAFMTGVGGGKGLMQAGMAAAGPMLMQTATQQPEMKTDKDMGQRYSYLPNAGTPTPTPDVPGYGAQGQNFGRERTYFRPQYAKLGTEEARSMYGFAGGGPVEAMSNANAIGASAGYPQSDIRTGAYSTPFQQPMGSNVVTGAQDAAVDPYTGQAQFADGGSVDDYTYDPVSQTYSKAGGQGITTVKPIAPTAGGQGGQSMAPAGGWASMTPAEQAAYYSANPTMAAVTQAGLSGLGALGFDVAQQNAVAHGFAPSYYSDPGAAVSADQNAAADTGGIGGGDISGASSDTPALAHGGMAQYASGGISDLGSYSDGGRLLRGPGDGISDSIPAMIGKKRPARLADGEFVVPARIVSELGNGSTEAGARRLYAMMDRVQKSRGKTVGKGKVAVNSRAAKHLPA